MPDMLSETGKRVWTLSETGEWLFTSILETGETAFPLGTLVSLYMEAHLHGWETRSTSLSLEAHMDKFEVLTLDIPLETSLETLPPQLVLSPFGELFFGAVSERGREMIHTLAETGERLRIPVPVPSVGMPSPTVLVVRR
ncbi:MAG: hypothetical protein DRP11_04785 [Candidatus Aenigmatarchaeota archaeon]|nr:MAG: hypothetical protein DRP11_04785 [Candidatus Aenigmarchaeota archaeon]